jgi:type III pantothenate kinase
MASAASGPWLLTLDRGNSTLDCMVRDATAQDRVVLPPERVEELSEFLSGRRPTRAVGVSAVSGGLDRAASRLAELGVELRLAGRDLPCPLQLEYRPPEGLGADRWVAALAAHRQFGAACVVDLGTATTVDLVDRDGVYRGGAIAPGFRALLVALAEQAPELPAPQKDFPMPPDSSRAAVAMGVQVGFCGMVERLVGDILGDNPGPSTIVLTGGGAQQYLRHGRLAAVHVPDLVHRGLGLLLDESCAS